MSMYGAHGAMDEEFSSMYRGRDATLFGLDFGDEPSRTRQEFADECDINTLMARYEKTGLMPTYQAEPQYFDATEVPNFQEAMQLKLDADQAFMRLPAVTRREFDNDPMKFVAFAADRENLPKMREWGLAAPEAVPEPPMKVEVVNREPEPEKGS